MSGTESNPTSADVDRRLQVFVDTFNIVYPDWAIHGNPNRDLHPRYVDFDANLRTYWGRCGPRYGGRVYYRVNADWWAEHELEERLGLLIHELAHVKEYPGHPPEFWEQVVMNYRRLKEHAAEVDDIMGEKVDWQSVSEWLVRDPTNETVDTRSEVAYERRQKLAAELDFDGELEPFSGMQILTLSAHGENAEHVDVDELEYEAYTIEELVDFFHARPRPGLKQDGNKWVIEPPVVRQIDADTYEVVEGDRRTALAVEAVIGQCDGRSRIAVRKQDE